METVLSKSPRDKKVYGLIFLLGGVLNLASNWRDISSIFTLFTLAIPLSFFIIGVFALRASSPARVWALRLGTVLGFFAGGGLALLTIGGMEMPGNGSSVFYALIIPLPMLMSMGGGDTIGHLAILLHFLSILLIGTYAFWMAMRSQSVRQSIFHTLCLVFMMVLFMQFIGLLLQFAMSGPASFLLFFLLVLGGHSMLMYLAIPLFHFLAYTLLIGVPAAFLGRATRSPQFGSGGVRSHQTHIPHFPSTTFNDAQGKRG